MNYRGEFNNGERAGLDMANFQAAGRSVLLTTVTSHAGPLAAVLFLVALLIGAVVTIVLVTLVNRDDRVDAIHAAAELLTALLPWPSRRRDALANRKARRSRQR
jgi:hypothetical protein